MTQAKVVFFFTNVRKVYFIYKTVLTFLSARATILFKGADAMLVRDETGV